MPALNEFQQVPFGGWIRGDGSGPYRFSTGQPPGQWTQLPSGFWQHADGSGPYYRDLATGAVRLATSVFVRAVS